MPFYKVWYRNNPDPLEYSSASILHEGKVLDLVLQKENIIAHPIPDAPRGAPASTGPSLKEIIARNNLAPVRYTEDESEPFTIG